jgi:catechol 2,3-dioxygenase-like lactoylglutathione lyase family enzyme
MAARLDHTIIPVHDKEASATFLAEILALGSPKPFGPSLLVEDGNGVTLAFIDAPPGDRYGTGRGHYAFLVTEEDFDGIFARVKERGIRFWADPAHQVEGVINNHNGGRGFLFDDPSGHNMEVLTRPHEA